MTIRSASAPLSPSENRDTLAGILLALVTYGIWGFLPLYMKMLGAVPAVEVVAHRISWSVPIALLMIWASGGGRALRMAFTTPKMLGMACLCAALISMNWGIYVWAIAAGHTVEAALGYFINPLFGVWMGWLLLKEPLSRLQWFALGLAAAAVIMMAVVSGRVPFVGLGLALTWGFYAYFKKSLPIGANEGFALEVLLLLPFGLAYILWISVQGEGSFMAEGWHYKALLAGTGVVTAVPLILYANAAKRMRLSSIAMMQYISPTLIFLCAVFIFKEPFGGIQMVAFPMIWLSLVIYSWSMMRQRKG